jgi:hypothetical protein
MAKLNKTTLVKSLTTARPTSTIMRLGTLLPTALIDQNKPTMSIQSNTINGPRPVVSRVNRGFPHNNNNINNNNSQMMKQPQQSYGRVRVNHIHAQDAQTTSGVVLGELLVSSILATVLFDSGASHSFISSSFVEEHKIPIVLLKLPLITRTPRSDIKCHLGCSNIRIILSGVVFLADLVVLKSKGIDVILGMDWLTQCNGVIGCVAK